MAADTKIYLRVTCTFCRGKRDMMPYTTCPYCNSKGTEYIEANLGAIATYCKEHLTEKELDKLKNLLDN